MMSSKICFDILYFVPNTETGEKFCRGVFFCMLFLAIPSKIKYHKNHWKALSDL